MKSPTSRPKQFALAALAGVVSLVLLEGIASVLLALSDAEAVALTEGEHCDYDPLLGWVNKRNLTVVDLYGPGLTLTTNERGLRRRTSVTPAPPTGRFRILCLGDSFTLGHGVDDRATFPAAMERLVPGVEALNMGQGGYGIDQCYLWYRRDAADLQAEVVLLSFIAPDFERILSDRFQGDYPKPRLTLEGDSIRLPQDPLPEDWTRSRNLFGGFVGQLALGEVFARLGRRGSGGGKPAPAGDYRPLGEAVLRDLQRLVQERGGRLVLAHLPLRDPTAGHPDLSAWLNPLAEALGTPLIDLREDFAEFVPGEAASLYLADGHMNASGNRRIAEILLARLQVHFPALKR